MRQRLPLAEVISSDKKIWKGKKERADDKTLMSCHGALLDFVCPTKISLPSGRKSGRVPIKTGGKRRVLLFAEIFCAVSDEEEDEEGEEEGKKNPCRSETALAQVNPPPPPLSPSPPGNSGGGRRKLSLPVLSLRPTEQKRSKAKPPSFSFLPPLPRLQSRKKVTPPFPFPFSAFSI